MRARHHARRQAWRTDDDGRGGRAAAAARVVPLAEMLPQAGYATAAFTEDAFVDPASFQRGFDLFVADRRAELPLEDRDASGGADTWRLLRTPGLVEETIRKATTWLRTHADERFFLFVHTYQVHDPFTPPPAYAHLADIRPHPVAKGALPPRAELEATAAQYTAEVAYTDAALAPLLNAVDELGLADDTIVVVTSDHGQSFGEQGLPGHGSGIEEEQIRVPLIVRAPGLVESGRRVETMAGLVDVTPTVLDLLDLAVPPWMQGVSLAPMMRAGYNRRAPSGRILPTEAFGARGVRADSWKGVHLEATDVFDTKFVNARGVERTVTFRKKAMGEAFDRVAAECARAQALLGDAGRPGAAQGLDPEREEKLRALGYLD